MSDKQILDPFTSEETAGNQTLQESENICISCEG